jgi:hypothetical protein
MEHRRHLTNLRAGHFVITDYMNRNYDVGVASKSTTFTSNFIQIGPCIPKFKGLPLAPHKH